MWHKILSKSSYNIIYRVWVSSHVSQVFQDLGCRAINYSRYRYDFISMSFFQTIIIQIFLNIHVHKYLFTGHDGRLLSLKWVDFEFDELPSSTHHYTPWCKYSITKNHWISLDYWKFKCNLHLLEHYFFDWLLWVIDFLLFDQTFIENAPDFSAFKR